MAKKVVPLHANNGTRLIRERREGELGGALKHALYFRFITALEDRSIAPATIDICVNFNGDDAVQHVLILFPLIEMENIALIHDAVLDSELGLVGKTDTNFRVGARKYHVSQFKAEWFLVVEIYNGCSYINDHQETWIAETPEECE